MTLDPSPACMSQPTPHDAVANARPPLSCRRISGPRWHVVWTEHHRERIAANAILAAGFEAYLPLHLNIRDAWRRSIGPLWPRYVLAKFDAAGDWSGVSRARGVMGLICHAPGRPTPLPDSAVDELLARTSDRGIVDDPGEAPQKPLGGVPTEWLRLGDLDAGGRVRLLYRLFGASVARREMEDAA